MKQRTAAVLAWSLWGLVLMAAFASITLLIVRETRTVSVDDILFTVVFGTMGALGALIASRQPGNPIGWLFLLTTITGGVLFVSDEYWRYALDQEPPLPGAAWARWLSDWLWAVLLSVPLVFVPLFFPDGRLPSRRWRPFAWFAAGYVAFAILTFALDPNPSGPLPNPVGVQAVEPLVTFMDGPGFVIVLLFGVISLISVILRYRRAGGQQRQQIKWFAFGVAVLVSVFIAEMLTTALGVAVPEPIPTILVAVGFMALPVGAGIAILRHGLYDIDVVINRTVLYGVLAVFITAVYVGIVVGVGALVGSRGNLFLSIVATAVVALAFQPVRQWARHLANRLVYGKRATPYEVLSEFSEHLGDAYSTDAVLPRMAGMIGEATGSERAAVWVRVGDDLRQAAGWPEERAAIRSLRAEADELPGFPAGERAFAVRHQGELLGALSVSTSRRESLNPTQEKLIEDLAGQAGLILRNVRLIEELRASRQRLVSAQDEERRRLERNIHDGAQQQLVALAVKLRLVEALAAKDPAKATEMAGEAKAEAQNALDDLRDLARGIYPPLLADRGLAAALEAQARKAPVPVEVEPDGISRYSQETEAAAYFCVLEALQNIAKYAEASRVTVRLSAEDGDLVFEVRDDGRGFDVRSVALGSGLQNMRDRLDALGGRLAIESAPGRGTTVTGRLPVAPG